MNGSRVTRPQVVFLDNGYMRQSERDSLVAAVTEMGIGRCGFLASDLAAAAGGNTGAPEDYPEEPEYPAASEYPDEPEGAGAPESAPEGAGAGSVAVDVDRIQRPGFAASGSITCSDGVKGQWGIDNYGRIALAFPGNKGYNPSAADQQAFMMQLRSLLGGY